ncbi:MAG: hypothetical protein C4B59_03580 [Candidatus Methanogaster sp.]|uniref:Uncharacterized protein n=1 Tax=Candidatus Methanogaster sp. TaxID=3386292 RepID=A0AC61L5S8_9EURY|nr:MAG: hypothetical protein C4B59_03580 [ANME-2 cluster archaeon]
MKDNILIRYMEHITIILILSGMLYTKFFAEYTLAKGIQSELLLLPTIYSVSVSLDNFERIQKEFKLSGKRNIMLKLATVVAIIFISAAISLCFDIYPIPDPTSRWLKYWFILFITGLFLQFILFYRIYR